MGYTEPISPGVVLGRFIYERLTHIEDNRTNGAAGIRRSGHADWSCAIASSSCRTALDLAYGARSLRRLRSRCMLVAYGCAVNAFAASMAMSHAWSMSP